MEQHAHGRRHVGVIRLGAVIVDPLLDHAERSARIDLRRDRRMRGLDQNEHGGNEGCVTHVMLPTSVAHAMVSSANVSGSVDSRSI